jgi:RNA polymerase sigma-54 factor
MKTSLQLSISQQLTMTPQLQQAIKLLQLSSLELKAEIQSALESNPLLDELEEDELQSDDAPLPPPETASAVDYVDSSEDIDPDLSWDFSYVANSSAQNDDDDFENDLYAQRRTDESLHEHLSWQMRLTPFSDVDKLIAVSIIDAIADDGYLTLSLEELRESFPVALDIDEAEILAVLHRIQQFEPAGVAARDLAECLSIQLKQMPVATAYRKEALDIIQHSLPLLRARDAAQLMKKHQFTQEQLSETIQLLQTLTPYPGSRITVAETEYIIPDVIVSKRGDKWYTQLNPEVTPRLSINNEYAKLIRRADTSSDNTYLRTQLQEARWLIKSLESRNSTLLKVAQCIVDRQIAFFEQGDEAMKPLILADVAQQVEMHESTISRVTTEKYMHTPRGIFELKYFFSSHLSTQSGNECSSTAIRALIKKIVAAEKPNKPLSDNQIATMLKETGIRVARRTVAKYRELLQIPPSVERKKLNWAVKKES